MAKLRWTFYLICFFFILSPKRVFAQVVINKFYSAETSDWVEIYNTGGPVDTSSLALVDGGGNIKVIPQCMLQTNANYVVDWFNRLDNSGDRIGLTQNSQLIDCVSYGNGSVCEGRTVADLTSLSAGEYAIRQPVGTGAWTKTSDASRSDNSQCLTITPTSVPPTVTPLPPPTSTPTPVPVQNGTYKINRTKDDKGVTLSNVKISVDGLYTKHIDEQSLTFCSGCYCDDDKAVDCGFGQHKITMEKDGFDKWEETKTINPGDSFEVNPIVKLTVVATPTINPSATANPSPKPTAAEGNSVSNTNNQTLGEQTSNEKSGMFDLSNSGEVADKPFSNETKEISSLSRNNSNYLFPGAAVLVGLGFVGFSIFSFLRTNKKIE